MQVSMVLDKEEADRLKLNKQKMGARLKTVDERLAEPIAAVVTPLIEGHSMVYGYEFESGMELASFATGLVKFTIAALMEQGKLQKTIPGSSKKDKEKAAKDSHPGQYL